MARIYQAVSADGHVETPPERWMKFVPEKYRDRAPRLVKLDDGGEAWQLEGQPLMHNGLNLTADNPIRKKHFLFSFIADPIGMKVRDLIPVDNLLWGTDFPHSAGSYPHSRQTLDFIFPGVPESVKRKILVETPCKFFGLDPNKELTETPAAEAAAVR